jgi:tRNA-dihydrouridine synthase B
MRNVKIGDVSVEAPFALAPMAGVNCTSFRLMCRESGAGLIYTQMYHCKLILAKASNDGIGALRDFINIQESERPVAIQLVGADASEMGRAAKIVSRFADIIDVNFGCPDPDMVKACSGAYFSKYPEKMRPVIEEVISNSSVPVTAKIRIGWDSHSINGVAVAQSLASLGISGLAVHGRVATQMYAGKANWEIIRHIKEKLSIPVIGNGDINNAGRAIEMLDRTGCDIAMIGRRAMGDPGIFSRCCNKIGLVKKVETPSTQFRRFMDYYSKYDRSKSFTELRTHALWFSKRAGLGPAIRRQISAAKTIEGITGLLRIEQDQ